MASFPDFNPLDYSGRDYILFELKKYKIINMTLRKYGVSMYEISMFKIPMYDIHQIAMCQIHEI